MAMVVTPEEKERAVLRSRRMAETDRISDLATARDIGQREFEQKAARAMLNNGESTEYIVKYTGLSLEDVEKLRQQE